MYSRLQKRHINKLNNSGSTMLIVMVTIALISVLATVLMSMSYMNYNMKVTEMNSKKNFYSAEVVLDQINVGLQKEISESLEDAYVRSMQRYTLEDDVTRNTNFANYYIGELTGRLRTAALDTQYQIAPIDTDGDGAYDCGLVHYLDSSLQAAYTNGNLVVSSTNPKMQSVAVSKTAEDGSVTYEGQGLVLYNLHIEYTDANGFTSVIETNIRLKTPELTLVTKTAMPNVFDYCLVADAGIESGTTSTTVTFSGNIYAGNDTNAPADPTAEWTCQCGKINVGQTCTACFAAKKVDLGGIRCANNNTKWTIEGLSKIVSAGPIVVEHGATFTTSESTNCWAEEVYLPKYLDTKGGTLNLLGNTYVRDDLTIAGNGATVNLEGNYYGFGYGTTSDESSAIVINGKNAVLDMTALERLMLGGNAYIQTSSVAYDVDASKGYGVNNNTDILTGNSLAVKSDQIAYLVPAECIGVNGTNVLIGKNPMSAEEYKEWLNYESLREAGDAAWVDYKKVSLTKKVSMLDKSIGEYELNSTTGYKTVFRTVNGETLCYLYLDLTTSGASKYYKDFYSKAEKRMNSYITAYNNRILMDLSSMSNLSSRGTILTYSQKADGTGDIALVQNTINDATTEEQIKSIEEEYFVHASRFERMKAKLTIEESEVTPEELTKTVYANLVNESAMNSLTPGTPVVAYYPFDVIGDTRAVFINNKGLEPYVYTDKSICIIVATGDVKLTKDFDGLLIVDGKVYIESGVNKVEPNKTLVLKTLRQDERDEDGNVVDNGTGPVSLISKYFKNGEQYSMDTKLSGQVTNSMTGQSLGDLIVYENWAKQ